MPSLIYTCLQVYKGVAEDFSSVVNSVSYLADLFNTLWNGFSLVMDLSQALTMKLESDTRTIQEALRSHIHQHVSTKIRAVQVEAAKREEQWVRERNDLQSQIARLQAENALLRNGSDSPRGRCDQCARQKEIIVNLRSELQQCQEDSQEQQDRLEERVTRKRNKLKEYVRLLYAKDDEIEALETKCQDQAGEISELVDKYLTALEDEIDRNRVAPGGSNLSATELSDGEQSDQFDDEESLNSIEMQLNRLIARIGCESVESVVPGAGLALDGVPDSNSALNGDRTSKKRKI